MHLQLTNIVRTVIFTGENATMFELRRRHRARLERRLGPADRRQARREVPGPLWGAAYAYGGRRRTDEPPG